MSRNGKHNPPRPRIELKHSTATPEEAAAIAAAIEHFLRETASAPGAKPQASNWQRAGLLEGIGSCENVGPWL